MYVFKDYSYELAKRACTTGTIMMNTYTQPSTRLQNVLLSELSKSHYIFDHQLTPAWTGIVPETLRKRHKVIRSRHLVCSVIAIGKKTKYPTNNHNISAGFYEPYSRLAEIIGRYLGIGLGCNL